MSITPDVLANCRGHKVLVIEPFFYTPHVETGLEIAKVLSDTNAVTFAGPDALKCVTDETYKFTGRVLVNLSRKRNVSKFVSPSVAKLSREDIAVLKEVPHPAEVSRLVSLCDDDIDLAKVDNLDLGMGLRSSLVTLTRETSVSPRDYPDYSIALARDALVLYRLTKKLIRTKQFDLVVLFNGRRAPVRAIRRACEALGTRYFVHELGSSINKYALFDCATPHQPTGYRSWVDSWWRVADDPMRNARHFLDRRRQGIATSWYSFTGSQRKGEFPAKAHRKRVTFFTSSEDELAAIGDELRADSPFCDQSAAIRMLSAACRQRDYEFIIRFHPNTSSTETSLMQTAKEAAEIVCEPSSGIDSYALAESSDIVFTQNSTIGIESAVLGKPVYYTGRNIFESCRTVRRIRTGDDLSTALDGCAEVDQLDAFKYANFLGTHGIEFKYYKARGFLSGSYLGKDLNSPLGTIRDLRLRLAHGG